MKSQNPASDKQLALIAKLAASLEIGIPEVVSVREASDVIKDLKERWDAKLPEGSVNYFKKLSSWAGEENRVPDTRTELNAEIKRLKEKTADKPTSKQNVMLRQLAHETGQTYVPPANRNEASEQIDRLSKIKERQAEQRPARLDEDGIDVSPGQFEDEISISEEARLTGGTATAFRDDETVRISDNDYDYDDERFQNLTEEQREMMREREVERGESIHASRATSGGAWAHNAPSRPQIPGDEPSQKQRNYIGQLCRDLRIQYEEPIDKAEASRMIEQLKERQQESKEAAELTKALRSMNNAELQDALGLLRPKEQQVIHARYREGKSARETAASLGMSVRDVDLHETIGRDKVRRSLALRGDKLGKGIGQSQEQTVKGPALSRPAGRITGN